MLADLIVSTAPDWAEISVEADCSLRIRATPRHLSGAPTRSYALVIQTDRPAGAVSEAGSGRQLPAFCPERHINSDGTFCLGLERAAILDEEGARAFWQTLRTFLLSQQYAEKHGRWPPGRGLSHGDAAYDQLSAEKAAADCDLQVEYAAALDHQVGWLAGALPRISFTQPVTDECPYEPQSLGMMLLHENCSRCASIARLLNAEHARRVSEENFAFWAGMGWDCCETMPRCSLRRREGND